MNNYNNQEESLRRIKKKPENKVCADCNEKNPSWASLSFGSLVCLRCSGIHRNMSTKITRIKSTELDEFQNEWIELLDHIGNQKSNLYWEKGLDKSKKPNPDTDLRKLHEFITLKYTKKRFINDYEEDPVQKFLNTPPHLRNQEKHAHSAEYQEQKFTAPVITVKENTNNLSVNWQFSPKAKSTENFNFNFSTQNPSNKATENVDFLDFSDIPSNRGQNNESKMDSHNSHSKSFQDNDNSAFEFDFVAHNKNVKPSTCSPKKKRTKKSKSSLIWNNIPWEQMNQNSNQNNFQISNVNNYQGPPVNVTINNYKNVNNYNFYGNVSNGQINVGQPNNVNVNLSFLQPNVAHAKNLGGNQFENANFSKAQNVDQRINYSIPQGTHEKEKGKEATADFIMSLYKQTK